MVRHLHDLFALKEVVNNQKDEFYRLLEKSFEEDMKSGSRNLEKGLKESSAEALVMLQKDSLYRDEYAQFVAKVSYADEEDKITFDEALDHFKALAQILKA